LFIGRFQKLEDEKWKGRAGSPLLRQLMLGDAWNNIRTDPENDGPIYPTEAPKASHCTRRAAGRQCGWVLPEIAPPYAGYPGGFSGGFSGGFFQRFFFPDL